MSDARRWLSLLFIGCVIGPGLACGIGAELLAQPAAATSIAGSSGLLLHVPFDGGRTARVAAGDPEPRYSDRGVPLEHTGSPIEGRVGGAHRFQQEPGLHYSLSGQLLPERGTIAFWIRMRGVEQRAALLAVTDLQRGGVVSHIRLLRGARQRLAVRVLGTDGRAFAVLGDDRLDEGWHHVAWSWDAGRGGALYLDGRQVGVRASPWSVQGVVPHLLTVPPKSTYPTTAELDYDELYVFDRELSASQIAALARGEPWPGGEAPGPDLDDQWRAHRRDAFGWIDGAPLPHASNGVLALTQVAAIDARAWAVDCSSAIDGRPGGGFPTCAVERDGAAPLLVTAAGPYDRVQIDGRAAGRLSVADHGGGAPSPGLEGRAARQHWVSGDVATGALSFVPDSAARDDGRRIGEVTFFRDGIDVRPEAGPIAWLTDQPVPAPEGWPAEDRGACQAASSPPAAGSVRIPAWRRVHWKLGSVRGTALDGFTLRLALDGQHPKGTLRVELHDPRLPARRWLSVDVGLEETPADPPAALELRFDIVDRILDEHDSVWMSLVSEEPLSLRIGETGSRVELWRAPRARAVMEHVRSDRAVVKARFRGFSEARPWNKYAEPEVTLAERSQPMRELFTLLAGMRSLAPDDPATRALWAWTHKKLESRSPVELPEGPPFDGAPRWARLQREVFATAHRILVDWLDRRATPDGELGDGYGDDTDFAQNFPMVALVRDPQRRLARSAARLADRAYSGGYVRRGLNAGRTDTLHAYEAGINVQPVAALLNWGEPRFVLRMLETLRAVDERLVARDAPGVRRFRSSYFGADDIIEGDGYDYDQLRNALMLHPAAFLMYRHGEPRARRLITDWTDGWLDRLFAAESPHRRPIRVASDGRTLRFADYPEGSGFADLLFGLSEMRELPRYRKAAELWLRPGRKPPPIPDVPALHLLDPEKYAAALSDWAGRARTHLPFVHRDSLGRIAYRAFLAYPQAGDEAAALEALEATLRNLQTLEPVYAAWEPKGDRVWLATNVAAAMALGDEPDQRGQLWPRHVLSYEGFSDLAAWVRERSDERVRVELFSFADSAESGRVRWWLPGAGVWEVRTPGGVVRRVALRRGQSFELSIPNGRLATLELRRVDAHSSGAELPDLALEATSEDGRLRVRLFNLGPGAAHDIDVRVVDGEGRSHGARSVRSLAGIENAEAARADLRFPSLPAEGPVWICVDPEGRVAELDEENNAARVDAAGRMRDGAQRLPASCRSPRGQKADSSRAPDRPLQSRSSLNGAAPRSASG